MAEVLREIQETFYYRSNLVGDFVVQVVLFSALIFMGGYSAMGAKYGVARDQTPSLLLLGYLFWNYSIWAISQMGSDVAAEASKGTLEHKFMSVAPPALLLAGKALGGIVTSSIFIVLVLMVIALLFHITIKITFGAFLSLIITLVGMYGLGFVFAGLALYTKKTSRIVSVFQIILLFISGTLTPGESLPGGIKWISMSLPLTQGIHIARLSALHIGIPALTWLLLLLSSLAYLGMGILVFEQFVRLVRVNGLLAHH
jgi:ABC-2 type transport system permease protein